MGLTDKERKALCIVNGCKCQLGIRPSDFGRIYFDTPEHRYLLESLSNQGEGACFGKKAWRAAGCILGKLQKKGYVRQTWGHYHITDIGKEHYRQAIAECQKWKKLEHKLTKKGEKI